MSLAVEKCLTTLRAEPLKFPRGTPSLNVEVDAISAWMDPRHTSLLQTLLENSGEDVQLPGSPDMLQKVGGTTENLRRDTRLKFLEFREKWVTRLEVKALLPFLQRNQWFVPHSEGGFTLAGKGTVKEARMLYLQTLHDMASDCARQWASVAGRLQALQEKFSEEWLRELPPENGFRMPPVLEATLRAAEFQAWKSVRLSLGNIAEETFVHSVARWEELHASTPEALMREIAKTWRKLDPSGNGFIGYMRAMSSLTEQLTLAMLDHYDRKWELFLRGFSEV